MEQSTCRHCGDDIDQMLDGTWWSEADDVCGTDLRRDHQPVDAPTCCPVCDDPATPVWLIARNTCPNATARR